MKRNEPFSVKMQKIEMKDYLNLLKQWDSQTKTNGHILSNEDKVGQPMKWKESFIDAFDQDLDVLFCFLGNEIAGTIAFGYDYPDGLEIVALELSPFYRDSSLEQELGAAILESAVEFSREQGRSGVLYAWPGAQHKSFFLKFGFLFYGPSCTGKYHPERPALKLELEVLDSWSVIQDAMIKWEKEPRIRFFISEYKRIFLNEKVLPWFCSAKIEGEIQGIIVCYEDPHQHMFWVETIAVNPLYRKRGIATRLLMAAHEESHRRNLSGYLWTNSKHRGYVFTKHRGFKFYGNIGVHEPMQCFMNC